MLKQPILLLALSLQAVAHATPGKYQTQDLSQFLQEFHANPSQVMGQLPPKTDHNINQASLPFAHTSPDRSREARDLRRQRFCTVIDGVEQCLGTPQGRAAIGRNDQPQAVVDTAQEICGGIRDAATRQSCLEQVTFVKSLRDIDQQELHSYTLKNHPWSDDYWALAKGVLAHRYADPEKSTSLDWKEAYDWMMGNPLSSYVEENRMEQLSPAEKYDLLVGDRQSTMTKAMWNEGKTYYDESGKVEAWMGICHGWAAAAYMLPRPAKAIKVMAADGKTELTFFPADIKALGSLLWAKNEVETRFIGGRCNTKDPARDASGRVTDPDCLDNNPGSWHLAVVNQIAKARRSMVMDATFDYEVWNHPIVSYSYSYFNPMTSARSQDFTQVAIGLNQYIRDPFKKFRSPQARQIVGVEMKVEYGVETQPRPLTYDSVEFDMTTTATYRYDLELDQQGNILGGEWYTQAHPDFLWTPVKGASAKGQADEYLLQQAPNVRWEYGKPVPYEWRRAASYAAKSGTPLALIVERLFQMAQARR